MINPDIIERLLEPGIVAIIRADSPNELLDAAEALLDGGVTAVEVTMTTPGALEVIRDAAARFGDKILIGVGTVLSEETCISAILAGAQYVVTPVTRPEIIHASHRYRKPVLSGALTPTECLFAHESGADFVKLFPADQFGPAYIKSVRAPLPMLRIIPTGGVTPETAAAYIEAGCVALGAGSSLVSREILQNRDWVALSARAEKFVWAIREARRAMSARSSS
jgi:2-dehydro-3-deoxyphosphogluconate aldolase/(4S)-4-hydroxy-2-oxoglutarate aldolase